MALSASSRSAGVSSFGAAVEEALADDAVVEEMARKNLRVLVVLWLIRCCENRQRGDLAWVKVCGCRACVFDEYLRSAACAGDVDVLFHAYVLEVLRVACT